MHGLALCAGFGGLEIGLRLLVPAARTVCFVERDAYVASALVARMAEGRLDHAPVWDDVTTFDGLPWRGKVDIVSAGYPCQPFSVAGRMGGEADHRYLWDDIFRIVRQSDPAYVVIENVANHFRLGWDRTLRDLLSARYRVAAGIFTAWEVGAPYERKRLFALAVREGVEGFIAGEDTGIPGPWGWGGEEDLRRLVSSPFEPGDRHPQPLLRGVATGMADRVDRVRGCGNGVNPYQAANAVGILHEKLFGV